MPGHVTAEPGGSARGIVEGLAEALIPALDEVAVVMAREIHDDIDELPGAFESDTLRTCRAHVRLVSDLLLGGGDPAEARAPAEALAFARDAVHQGVPLEAVVRKYRVGHAVFAREILRILQQQVQGQDELGEAISLATDWTFRYVDAVSGEVMRTYQTERERWVRSAAATRAEEVRRILDGGSTDAQESSRRLGYDLGRSHLAFVFWTAEGRTADGVLGTLERLAHALGRAVGGQDVLCAPLGSDVLAAWAAVPRTPDLDALLPALCSTAADAGASLSLGEVHVGIDGFRRSHQEAMHARRVAGLTPRPAGSAMRYSDAALNALLTADLAEAGAFVEQVLGALAEENDASRRLAATLRIYYDEGSSFTRTSRRLGVHQNTVAYRVKRAGEILGRPVCDRQLETWVALQLADVLRRSKAAG